MHSQSDLAHRAFLAVQRLAQHQLTQTANLLKAQGLSPAQYNVLRILRGASEALTCGEIAGRLIAHDPDVTRLLDRLEQQGWVSRSRERPDRRVVTSRLTASGRELLVALDQPLGELHRAQFAHLDAGQLGQLLTLLGPGASDDDSRT
ncbi:MarR family transcriptional regulator [Deinococcus irradiatisoli]|uniref:MarR family transcriptional regulator n=1 Tax=Deinococcus irradiatisoli TaxID=2202254 RepID=A0A2Z3JU33_9DEIO|nr:MarR family transcriptional regulator [Deinococcus irradiatisoli]